MLDVIRVLDRLFVTIESTDRLMGCRACGTRATIKDRGRVELAGLFPPSAARSPWCGSSAAGAVATPTALPAPGPRTAPTSPRPGPGHHDPASRGVGHRPRRSPRELGVLGARVLDARELGVTWHTVMDAVTLWREAW